MASGFQNRTGKSHVPLTPGHLGAGRAPFCVPGVMAKVGAPASTLVLVSSHLLNIQETLVPPTKLSPQMPREVL